MDKDTVNRKITDYDDDYDYYMDFWLGQGREYENLSEQVIIKKLLPDHGNYAIDIGGGFGRLLPLYAGRFNLCVLVDYSIKNLKQARIFAVDNNITNLILVAADASKMPFSDDFFDFAISVRLSHHFENPEIIVSDVSRVLTDGGSFIFEFANKRNFKSILKWMAGRQKEIPFSIVPRLVGKNIYNFHPKNIIRALRKNGFYKIRCLSASNFRVGALKRAFNPVFLAKTDLMLSGIFGLIYFGPSIFTCSYLNKNEQSLQKRDECFLNNIFRCPRCHKQLSLDVKCPHDVNFNLLSADGLSSSFRCIECGFIISEHDGIFDFR